MIDTNVIFVIEAFYRKMVVKGKAWFLNFVRLCVFETLVLRVLYHGDICYCLTASEWKCRDATKHAGLAVLGFKTPNIEFIIVLYYDQ